MQRSLKLGTQLLFIVILLMITTNLIAGGSNELPEDTVAVVNNAPITERQLERETQAFIRRLSSQGIPVMEAQMEEVRKQVLDNLIQLELLYQESQKGGIEVDESEIEDQVEQFRNRFEDQEEYESALSEMSYTEEAFREELGRRLTIRDFIEQEFNQKITIPEEESRAFYEGNPDLFTQPERIRASHILINVAEGAGEEEKAEARQRIEEVQQRLKKGENFADLAREVSEGPSKSQGGDLGYFQRGQMVKPFEQAAFSLSPGEVSGIVETIFGFHLILVVDKLPEQLIPYENTRERIEQYLKQRKVQEEIQELLGQLESEATIERLPVEQERVPSTEEEPGSAE